MTDMEKEPMNTSVAHSPTPWNHHHHRVIDDADGHTVLELSSRFDVGTDPMSGSDLDTRQDRANADYILTCVNSHAALVAVVADMLPHFITMVISRYGSLESHRELVNRARVAASARTAEDQDGI